MRGNHADHIGRHLGQIERILGKERLQAILECTGFVYANGIVNKLGGGDLGDNDCDRYLAAVKQILGEIPHSFARVNFQLAACKNLKNA